MNLFGNLRIGTRLYIGLGLVVALVVVQGAIGFAGLNRIEQTAINLSQHDAAVLDRTTKARVAMLDLRRFEKDYFLNIGAPATQAEYLTKWRTNQAALTTALKDPEGLATERDDISDVAS